MKTFCPECGPDVAIGEEGCCASCGATATGGAVKIMAADQVALAEENRRLKQEVEELKVKVMWLITDTTMQSMSVQLGEHLTEINKLKAELVEFKASNEKWFLESKKAYAEKHEALAKAAAAYLNGLDEGYLKCLANQAKIDEAKAQTK